MVSPLGAVSSRWEPSFPLLWFLINYNDTMNCCVFLNMFVWRSGVFLSLFGFSKHSKYSASITNKSYNQFGIMDFGFIWIRFVTMRVIVVFWVMILYVFLALKSPSYTRYHSTLSARRPRFQHILQFKDWGNNSTQQIKYTSPKPSPREGLFIPPS